MKGGNRATATTYQYIADLRARHQTLKTATVAPLLYNIICACENTLWGRQRTPPSRGRVHTSTSKEREVHR